MAVRIIRNALATKYGKIHSKTPDSRAIPRRCFLPYIKYPIPIEPNNTPHMIDAALSIMFQSFLKLPAGQHRIQPDDGFKLLQHRMGPDSIEMIGLALHFVKGSGAYPLRAGSQPHADLKKKKA